MEKVWGLRSEIGSEDWVFRHSRALCESAFTLLEEEEGNSVRKTRKLHSTQLSPAFLNDGTRTQRKGNCRESVRGRCVPQAPPLTILTSLLSCCIHGISLYHLI